MEIVSYCQTLFWCDHVSGPVPYWNGDLRNLLLRCNALLRLNFVLYFFAGLVKLLLC